MRLWALPTWMPCWACSQTTSLARTPQGLWTGAASGICSRTSLCWTAAPCTSTAGHTRPRRARLSPTGEATNLTSDKGIQSRQGARPGFLNSMSTAQTRGKREPSFKKRNVV